MEKPILFSDPMVRAILEGRKTQTRRIVKPQLVWKERHGLCGDGWHWKTPAVQLDAWDEKDLSAAMKEHCPYGQPGDRLWVRETFCIESSDEYSIDECVEAKDGRPFKPETDEECWQVPHYRATEPNVWITSDDDTEGAEERTRWKPSIHMPRWASRITLEVTGVRVQRLNLISNEDAIAEGIDCVWRGDNGPQEFDQVPHFKKLWDSINAARGFGWDTNPFVWVITFKRIAGEVKP